MPLFDTQAKEMVPKTYEHGMPEGFLESMFNKITKQEIMAPVCKDVRKCEFELRHFVSEIKHRLCSLAVNGGEDAAD